MLTLLPLNGLQDSFKKRNSKTLDQFGDRRGSISVYDNYSLPNSKSSMRRFSSYDELAPFFEEIMAQEKPVPVPSQLVKTRRGSVSSALRNSFKRRRSFSATSSSPKSSEGGCSGLDAQIIRIKAQLSQLRSEDDDISRRVDDLHCSVDSLYSENITPQDELYYNLRQERIRRSNSMQKKRASLSTPGLESISESSSEDEEDGEERRRERVEEEKEQSFEGCCRRRRAPQQMVRSRPRSYASPSSDFVSIEEQPTIDTKEYCLLNNTVRPKARSTSQLSIIRNDLASDRKEIASSKRLSVLSTVSDSVLITHHQFPNLHPYQQKCVL